MDLTVDRRYTQKKCAWPEMPAD